MSAAFTRDDITDDDIRTLEAVACCEDSGLVATDRLVLRMGGSEDIGGSIARLIGTKFVTHDVDDDDTTLLFMTPEGEAFLQECGLSYSVEVTA